LCEQAAQHYSSLAAAALAPVLDRLLELPALADLATYDGSHRSQAVAKRATSELTGRFVGTAVAATRAVFGREPLGRYAADLIVPADTASECALLKGIAYRYVMRRPGVDAVLSSQRRVLIELVDVLVSGGAKRLSTQLREAWEQAEDDAGRLRVIIDQVAQLTDSSAIGWHARLAAGT